MFLQPKRPSDAVMYHTASVVFFLGGGGCCISVRAPLRRSLGRRWLGARNQAPIATLALPWYVQMGGWRGVRVPLRLGPRVAEARKGPPRAAPEAVRQAVRGGFHSGYSGWGRLLSATNAIKAGAWRQGHSGWA